MIFLILMVLRDILVWSHRRRKAKQQKGRPRRPRRGVSAAGAATSTRSKLMRSLLGSSEGGDGHLYLLHPSVERPERSSQRMLASPQDLHEHVLPIASHLARIFGFQQRQQADVKVGASPLHSTVDVYSNVACQAQHVCRLLVHVCNATVTSASLLHSLLQ